MTGDDSKVAAFRARDKKKVDAFQEALRSLVNTPDGRHVLACIVNRCHVMAISAGNDPMNTAFLEGERNVGLWLLSQLQQCESHKKIVDMLFENTKEA